ncbi:hypothetical protein Tco_0088449 [Tanacetum coccineum]
MLSHVLYVGYCYVDNMETEMGNEKMDVDNYNIKIITPEHVVSKEKLEAFVHKRKNKQGGKDGERVVHQGKLAALAEKTKKKQAEIVSGKRVAGKRKKAVQAQKVKKTQADVENAKIREMLYKLEADVLSKDGGGDTVSDEERVLEEDDVFEDYSSEGVPTDLEGIRKYLAAYLKRLKELRDQMFAVPTYSQQPRNDTDQNDDASYIFLTPENGGKQFPFTQVYGTPTEYAELFDKVGRMA